VPVFDLVCRVATGDAVHGDGGLGAQLRRAADGGGRRLEQRSVQATKIIAYNSEEFK